MIASAGTGSRLRERCQYLPIYFSAAALVAGSGVLSNVVALRGGGLFSPAATGMILAAYFAGFGTAAFFGGALVARAGRRRCYLLGVLLTVLCAVAMPALSNPVAWALLRFATGAGAAIAFVAIEGALNQQATSVTRGRILGIYMIAAQLGLFAGQLITGVTGVDGTLAFAGAALLYVSAALATPALAASPAPVPAERDGGPSAVSPLFEVVRYAPFGVASTAAAGIFVGGWLGVGPTFATDCMGSIDGALLFMSTLVFGGLILQHPVGALADRVCRGLLIRTISVMLAGIAIALVSLPAALFPPIASALILGALGFTLYPLASAYVQERVGDRHRDAAAGACLLAYSLGATAAPLLAAQAQPSLGASAIAYLTATIMLWLAVAPTLSRVHPRLIPVFVGKAGSIGPGSAAMRGRGSRSPSR